MTWRGPAQRLNLSPEAWRMLRTVYADQLSRVPRGARFAYGVSSALLGLLGRRQQRLAPSLPPPRRPLFVLGHWRSGTTLLHELLACDPRHAYPSTYACMNPAHFLLSERGAQVRSVRRPMDGMTVTTASPQEDEFALLGLGARSPYEAMLFPHALDRALATTRFDRLTGAEQARWRTTLRSFLSLVASRAPERTLLLKSPPHVFRVAALREVFPDARFVLIVRHPHAIASSTRRMWNELFALYALTPPPWPDPLPAVVQTLGAFAEAASGLAGVHVLRFEDLLADPHAVLRGAYAALDLGNYAPVQTAVTHYLADHASHRPGTPALEAADQAAVARGCRALFERFGYEP